CIPSCSVLLPLDFLSLFFLILRRPPSSPLFPYTTLFRSHSDARARFVEGRRQEMRDEVELPEVAVLHAVLASEVHLVRPAPLPAEVVRADLEEKGVGHRVVGQILPRDVELPRLLERRP